MQGRFVDNKNLFLFGFKLTTMEKKKIGLGCDHAGYEYKEEIRRKLEQDGFEVVDYGTHSNESVDYPDYVHPLASAVENSTCSSGFLICGSANGVAITANKHQGVRAAIAWRSDVAMLARQHNDANILCIPARFVSLEDALGFVTVFLNTPFEGGRHQNRVNKIPFSNTPA
jgi:ribose 5-phosphate isomerase B